MKIKEVIKLWQEGKKDYVKRSTMSAYQLIIKNYILPDLGEKMPKDITNDFMNKYAFSVVERGCSKKTATDICIVLKMVMGYAFDHLDVPFIKYKIVYPSRFHEHKEALEVYTEAEYKKITSFVLENLTQKRMAVLITLFTGMRIGEICALKWKHIDVENKLIQVRETVQRIYVSDGEKKAFGENTELIFDTPKTANSYRDVPIIRELMPIIKRLKPLMNDEFFVASGDEKVCEPRTFRSFYNKFILEDVKLGRCIKFHGMRHSFASRLIASGVDIKTTSTILGHANVSITMDLYVHPTMDNKLSGVNKALGRMFK